MAMKAALVGFLENGGLVIDKTSTVLDLAFDILSRCYRCGPVTLRRDDLLRRYGADYRVVEIYNDGHHNQHCPHCAGPIRLLIKWFDPDDRSCEIPEDEE
jgi:hypothetical protein